jgi:hypothetical protein
MQRVSGHLLLIVYEWQRLEHVTCVVAVIVCEYVWTLESARLLIADE